MKRSLYCLCLALASSSAAAEYGFSASASLRLNAMFNADAVDPNWNDMFRIRRINTRPPFPSGDSDFTARFSSADVRYARETAYGDLTLYARGDLIGLGEYAGQTRPRLSRLYFEWGRLLIGQNDSLFRDNSSAPDTLEWFGPVGLASGVAYQIRYQHPLPSGHWALGLEDVTVAIDPVFLTRIGGQSLYDPDQQQDFPDLVSHYRRNLAQGHIQLGAVLRRVVARGERAPGVPFKATDTGWGLNLSTSYALGTKDTLKAAIAGGHGIAGYMNEGGADMVIANNRDPATATAQHSHGWSAYLEHSWRPGQLSSSIGLSAYTVNNASFESNESLHRGIYASANLLYRPNPTHGLGIEALWGQREDKDGTRGTARSLLLNYRYNFSFNRP